MSRKGKGLWSESVPCEDLVEYDVNMKMVSGVEAMAASANATSSTTLPTNEDIPTAIHRMKSVVDERFDKLRGLLSSLKTALSAVSERASTTKVAVDSHEKRLEDLDRRHESLASQCIIQQAKLDHLEACSSRQNIHIVRVKEKARTADIRSLSPSC